MPTAAIIIIALYLTVFITVLRRKWTFFIR